MVAQSIRKKIMIVEDDPALRQGLYHVLRTTECDMVSASSGDAALRQVPREKPDLILLDLVSESVDGITFLKMLRSFAGGQKIPVLALVENDQKKRTAAGLAGATEMLEPEPEAEDLLRLVARSVELPDFDIEDALWQLAPIEVREVMARPRPKGKKLSLTARIRRGLTDGRLPRLALTDDAGKK